MDMSLRVQALQSHTQPIINYLVVISFTLFNYHNHNIY